ncbi:MAG: DUF3667 domain-containing protein [Saprospiraceae bacterium]|nr:DUF3667 domain-containing protein [Saprospiraceae bacterium]
MVATLQRIIHYISGLWFIDYCDISQNIHNMEEQVDQPVAEIQEFCPSCGAKRKGDYCRKCGEKRIIPERDFSIRKFLNQTLWHYAHFDSKLLKSIWLLFSKPGFLTAEWIAGRRVGYMKPIQMFLVASVLFYFFLPTTTAHFTGPWDMIEGYKKHDHFQNIFQYDFEKAFAEKAAQYNVSEEQLAKEFVALAAVRSKTWLFVLIPVWGACIFLFFRRKIPWLVPHLVFAMHALTFYILLDLSVHPVLHLLGFENAGKYIFLFLMLSFPVYQALAVHRVYGSSWPLTIVKTVGIDACFILLILMYRQIVTISVVAML